MIGKLDTANRRLYFLFLASFAEFGIIFLIYGAALPQLIRNYHWSYAVTGLVLAASAVGYFLSTMLCGFLLQRVPAKLVLLVGISIGALSVSLFGRVQSPWVNLGLNLALGLCQGSMEVVANIEIIHMEREGQSRLMNLLHAMFCVGAIVGPGAVGIISGAGQSMLTVFLGAGILLVLLGVLFGLVRFPRASQEKTSRAEPGPRLLREPILAILTLLLLVYVGSEIGVSTWSSEYIVQTIGATAYQGAYAVGLVWAGLLAGRLLVSFLYKGRRQEILMLGLSALSTAMILVVLLVHSPWALLAALFLTGLGFSAFYPLAMSLVGRYYKSGVAVGWAASGGGVGSIAFPLLMSVMAQTVGIRAGFWFYLGLNCLLVALTGVLVRLVRHRAAPAA